MKTTLPPLYKEGFEVFSREKKAENMVDYLLDMCGSPHHRKNIEEASADSGTFSLNNRPYDHPRQIRIRPIVDIDIIEDERDVMECDDYETEPEDEAPEGFDGADIDDGEEHPATEKNPQKVKNAINNVPNQNAPALLHAVKKDFMVSGYKEYFKLQLNRFGVTSPSQLSGDAKKKFFNTVNKGWKAKNESVMSERGLVIAKKMINPIAKKMNALAAARKAKGLPGLSRKQLARMVSAGA